MSRGLLARYDVKIEPPESQDWAVVAGVIDPSGVLWRFAELLQEYQWRVTNIAGMEIPSTDPIFLALVIVHVLLGLSCTLTGAIAMLSQKRAGLHPRCGTIYFWCLAGIFLTATGLAAVRWAEDYHLCVLGALSFAAAYFGRRARRRRSRNWARLHITGMGTSYVLLLIAFYVDNGKQLPIWRDLPHFTYWALPLAVGIPLIVRALLWHPLARQTSSP